MSDDHRGDAMSAGDGEVERQILEYRKHDVGFFRVSRVWYAIRYDPTVLLEVVVGVLGLLLNGILIALSITSFPPTDVEFLLRSWPLLNGPALGGVLSALGALQVVGTATRWHQGRALVAGVAFAVTTVVAVAYQWADLPNYYQAWVMYSSIAACELYLVVRNLRDKRRVEHNERLISVAIQARRAPR